MWHLYSGDEHTVTLEHTVIHLTCTMLQLFSIHRARGTVTEQQQQQAEVINHGCHVAGDMCALYMCV